MAGGGSKRYNLCECGLLWLEAIENVTEGIGSRIIRGSNKPHGTEAWVIRDLTEEEMLVEMLA